MISPRDIFPTIVAAASGYVGFLALAHRTMPLGLSNRLAILGLFIIGLATCATSGLQNPDWKQPYIVVMSILGGLIFLLALIGFIKPTTMLVALLAWSIVGMWLLTTGRHAIV